MPKLPEFFKNGHAKNSLRAGSGLDLGRFAGRLKATTGRLGRLGRFNGEGGVAPEVSRFLIDYISLPDESILVVTSWVLAAWLKGSWDRFPHLAITSPDRRCGKTRLLDLLRLICPEAYYTSNISPAALYRLIESKQPTLLLDEAQSLRRRGSESSEVLREILNAGIDRNSTTMRIGGKDNSEIKSFRIYSPKAIAMIGEPDGVLADRCLPIEMKRKTSLDDILPYRSRIVEPVGRKLHDRLSTWAKGVERRARAVYDSMEVLPILNDRMAELLLPLQTVLQVACPSFLPMLEGYAIKLDERDMNTSSPGVRLLSACREILELGKVEFLLTQKLLGQLYDRDWEPWSKWSQGEPMTSHALGGLLRPFGVHSSRDEKRAQRGFARRDFEEAWKRYLPPLPR